MDSAAPPLPDPLPVTPRARRVKAVAAAANPLNPLPLPRWTVPVADPIRGRGAGVPARDVAGGVVVAPVLSTEARAGAALFALDQIIRADPPWLGAFRMRLALQATVASARLLRLSVDDAALRDAECLTRPGDDPGPAGRIHLLWRRFGQRPVRLAGETVEALAVEAGAKSGAGEGAAEVLALMQADADLAHALGWEHPVPLAATVIADPIWREGRERRPFRAGGEGWNERRMALVGMAATRAHAMAVDLARRAQVVTAAADTLRTRDGGAGVRQILADDCVAPWRMAKGNGAGHGKEGLGSDRAARRFCESLHAMGALRLLTDRPTFRLYGL